MTELDLVRDRVCIAENVHHNAVDAGFLPARNRKGWYHHGASDKSPSAHPRGEGLYCFHCNVFYSVVDLCMLRDGHQDYVKALQTLASENGVEWKNISPKNRAQKRVDQERIRKIAADAGDWICGIAGVMREHKACLMSAACENWAAGNDALGDALAGIVERIPRAALSPESADPALIVRAYRTTVLAHPDAARRMIRLGREERERMEEATHWIVGMLSDSQQQEKAA